MKFFNFAPEIFLTQLSLFITLIVAAAILFTFTYDSLIDAPHWSGYVMVWMETLIVLSTICSFGYYMYPKKYNIYLYQVLNQKHNSKFNKADSADTKSHTAD